MAVKYVDISGRANYSNGSLNNVQGLIIHHTGGGGSPDGVVNTLNQRGLGVQYVMDRDGTIYQTLPDGARGAHMLSASNFSGAANPNLNNSNAIGIEIIAKNDRDVTQAQRESAQAFIADQQAKHPGIGDNVYGHGEENPGHKDSNEGMSVVNDYRNNKGITKDGIDKSSGGASKSTDNDGKKGTGDGDNSKKSDQDQTAKAKAPPPKKDKDDIKGTAGNFQKTQTQTIVSRMPTHEPWSGHPKSTEGPRQAIQGDSGSGGGGGGGGSGGSSSSPSGASADNGKATNPNGNQQQIGEQIYNRLISKGYTPAAADAAVGNFMGEGLNRGGGYGTAIVNDPSGSGSPGKSRGIGQWRNERGTALENFANQGGYSGGWRNIDAQVDFFDHELKTQYKGLYNQMQTSNDGAQINSDLVYKYERPAERLRASTTQQRIANARGFSNKRKANKPRVADPGKDQNDPAGSGSTAPTPAATGGSSSTPTA